MTTLLSQIPLDRALLTLGVQVDEAGQLVDASQEPGNTAPSSTPAVASNGARKPAARPTRGQR